MVDTYIAPDLVIRHALLTVGLSTPLRPRNIANGAGKNEAVGEFTVQGGEEIDASGNLVSAVLAFAFARGDHHHPEELRR